MESINREFGSVFVNTSENVAISLVANGWAKVKSSPNASNPASPYLEDLKKAEELAQASGLGAWTKDPEAIQQSVKASAEAASLMDDSFNAMAFLQQTGKGGTVAAIVEQVINGSMLRVTLLPTRQQAMIQVCGVQAPSMGRKPQGFASLPAAGEGGPGEGQAPPVVTAASIAASGGGGGGAAVGPEPFSKESKVFTESKVCLRLQ